MDAATGLRRSELLALKWKDVDFDNLQINVQRSLYMSVVGNCETEAFKEVCTHGPDSRAGTLHLEARQRLRRGS